MKRRTARTKVLIVADSILTREGLLAMLEEDDGYRVVGDTGDVQEGFRLARAFRPDLAIVGISLSTMNGLEFSRRLKERIPQIRILLLTIHAARDLVQWALQMGIAGYLLMDDSALLHHALQMIMGDRHFLSPSLSEIVAEIILSAHPISVPSQGIEKLSMREMQVLSMTLYKQPKSDIAERLHISVGTVKSHRVRIKQKLKVRSFDEIRRSLIFTRIRS